MYEYDDEEDLEESEWQRVALGALVGVGTLVLVSLFFIFPRDDDDGGVLAPAPTTGATVAAPTADDSPTGEDGDPDPTTAGGVDGEATNDTDATDDTAGGDGADGGPDTTADALSAGDDTLSADDTADDASAPAEMSDDGTAGSADPTTDDDPTIDDPTTDDGADDEAATSEPTDATGDVDASSAPDDAGSTTQPPAPSTTSAPPPTEPAGPSYPTLPDGSPEPARLEYRPDVITMSGHVPSQDAANRLLVFTVANASDPDLPIDDSALTIDESVPSDVGVRIVDAASQFPEGSAQIGDQHGEEIHRTIDVLYGFDDVTVVAIGHVSADEEAAGPVDLAGQRASSVVRFMELHQIDPARVSARTATAADPQLGRQTDIMVYGLLT